MAPYRLLGKGPVCGTGPGSSHPLTSPRSGLCPRNLQQEEGRVNHLGTRPGDGLPPSMQGVIGASSLLLHDHEDCAGSCRQTPRSSGPSPTPPRAGSDGAQTGGNLALSPSPSLRPRPLPSIP